MGKNREAARIPFRGFEPKSRHCKLREPIAFSKSIRKSSKQFVRMLQNDQKIQTIPKFHSFYLNSGQIKWSNGELN